MKSYKKFENKTYDEVNRYDFYIRRFLQYGIGKQYEGIVEINKMQYEKIHNNLISNREADIKLFKTYSVGFYEKLGTYVIQDVEKEVFECLYKSQRYEKNKIKHERERHLDVYFNQIDIVNLKSDDNIEAFILDKIEDENLREYLDSILSKKQSIRFYKNKIELLPLIKIALEEGKNVSAIKRCVDRATKKILNDYKKNK